MTVSTLTRKVTYIGNGATTSFAVPFKVLDEDDLVVQRRVISTNEIDKTYIGTEFTYDGIGEDAGTLTLAGTALSSLYQLEISRTVSYTQDLDIVNAGGFYPDTVEEQLDKMVMGIQQIAAQSDDLADRALLAPEGEELGVLPTLVGNGGKFLALDADEAPTWASGTGADDGLRTDLAASDGSALAGFIAAFADAGSRSVLSKLRDAVHAFDAIPTAMHAGIIAMTNLDDVQPYLQLVHDAGRVLTLPDVGLLWVGDTQVISSGGGVSGHGPRSIIKAIADFGNIPVFANATSYPAGANTAARLANRDQGLYFGNFLIDGNKANNSTATEFSAGVLLKAVDGAHFEKLWVRNPKGDGVTIMYAFDSPSVDYAVGCSDITGFIRTENCARQGVAPVCARGCNLMIYDTGTNLFSLDAETDHADNYLLHNYFRVISIGAGVAGTESSGGVGVGSPVGDCANNIIDALVLDSLGSGIIWRNVRNLKLRGVVDGTVLNGLQGLDLGAAPSKVDFDMTVNNVGAAGFAANETAGSYYDGQINIDTCGNVGASITNGAGGTLRLTIRNHTGQGLILTNTDDMNFPNFVVGQGSSHGIWLTGTSNGNRFDSPRISTRTFGYGFIEADTANNNRANNANISSGGDGKVSLLGATSRVELEPINFSGSWDPASIADGDAESKTFAVSGVSLGDDVKGRLNVSLKGCVLGWEVSAADEVKGTINNNTGASQDIDASTAKGSVTPIY